MLSHQQLYRQKLLQEQHEHDQQTQSEALHSNTAVITPTSADETPSMQTPAPASPPPQKPVASAPLPKPVPRPIITSYHPPPQEESQWRLEVTVEGTKQCLILGFVVNMIAMKCLASEHVVGKFVVCIVVTAGYVLSIYNPRPRFALQSGAAAPGHTRGGGYRSHDAFFGGDATPEAVALNTDGEQCKDPENCCLHRPASSSGGYGDEGGVGSAHSGHNGTPVRRGGTKKFAMGSSMARTHMNESGRSTNIPHSWAPTRGETFSIRSLEYKKTRRKEVRSEML